FLAIALAALQGNIWSSYCIADSKGAEFAAALNLPLPTIVISKGVSATQDAYSISAYESHECNTST
ncbi:MAG: hypothetical protein ACXWJK_09890, partial [Burkholderiaceae bacterium]